MDAQNKPVALVTGGGRGIGASIARRLAAEGNEVWVNDIEIERAEIVAKEIQAAGGRASAIGADIGQAEEVDAMFDRIEANSGAVTVLVNNAGIAGDAAVRNVTEEFYRKVCAVNLDGAYRCTRRALGPMRDARVGSIINVASRAWLGWWGQSLYATTKAGVVGMTRALAVEVASRNVRLNVIAPGLIDTPLLRDETPEFFERLIKSVPIGRLGTDDDVAEAAAFLSSQRSRVITGQVLYVCGGKSVYAYPDWPSDSEAR